MQFDSFRRKGLYMYITDDGIKLDAIIEMPDNKSGKMPMVIINHGLTGNKDEAHLVAVSDMFNEIGMATLRVDMYGHGKSEGNFRDHTLFKWMSNLMAVIDYVRGLDYVSDIFLCGHSQGGLNVMLAGGLKREYIKGIIAVSPACMIPEIARNGSLLDANFDPENPPEELNVWDVNVIGSNYIKIAQMIHLEEYIDKYSGPVLVVQGTDDFPDLKKSSKAASERYKNCVYREIEGADHCYTNHFDQMVNIIKDWIISVK